MAAPPPPPPLPQPHPHSVRYGIPNKNRNDVRAYMSHPDRNLNPDQLDIDQKINVDLLQIISRGINDIVNNLKMRLGPNFEVSNANVAAIKDLLDNLKTGIDADIAVINLDTEDKITLDNDNNNNLIYNDNFYRQDLRQNFPNVNIGYDTINIQPNENFTTLDSADNINVVNNQENLVNRDNSTIDEVMRRLKNCQNLEFLYLKKHDEIMRIFSFTINLFDKYKYAIKVILFLLKNLVYKDPDGTPPIILPIRMPLPIITNIKKLVTDQKNIQGVIDRMKDSIMPETRPINTPPPQPPSNNQSINPQNPYVSPTQESKFALQQLVSRGNEGSSNPSSGLTGYLANPQDTRPSTAP